MKTVGWIGIAVLVLGVLRYVAATVEYARIGFMTASIAISLATSVLTIVLIGVGFLIIGMETGARKRT